ncbi:unnamed protein product [Rotaria sordida]|uniref:STAS domain-containing protein n=1 Tax=Rotaria sordida TaxID=392033 RepID=A0A814CLM5_9BILA|nr:unnamed protein product [Rotaria sordida]CAF0943019.1 unnamed protein product [Rotaria sordida]
MDLSDDQNDKSDSTVNSRTHSIIVDRPIITQKSFNQVFIPTTYEDRTPVILFHQLRTYIRNKCIPSKQCVHDVVCGITIAIMQIPQGMGYALLARLPAITGLYASFFASLIYALLGTSRHLSMGGVAVTSLMTSNVVDRLSVKPTLSTIIPNLFNQSTIEIASNDALIDPSYAITIATTLAFMVGITQLLLCIFHLGFVTSFLSDSFISGYTTGTAILVFTSQLPDILGLSLKRYVGPFNIIYSYIEIFTNLKNINLVTLTISTFSITTLIIVKEYLDPFYKKKIKKFELFRNIQIPIPIELIVIIVGTLVSYVFDFNGRYKVKIVNTIGHGFRTPQGPALVLVPSLIKDAIMIAIVAFSISISLAKTYAKKFKYFVNPNQELAAYGACNIIGSFFASYATAASLSRTSVYVNAGGRTQLANLISCATLLIIILNIGSLFESLPKACLASIIIIAIKGLLLQTKDIYTIGRVTKLEAVVWIVTCLNTVILDVDYGLFSGIIVSLVVVILRQFRPRTTILGQYERSEVYKNAKRFTNVHEIPHIKIFRFESPIIYFNAEYFRESLLDAVGIDSNTGQKRNIHSKQSHGHYFNLYKLTHIIIDCSSINQLDYSGGKIFLQAIKELNDCKYKVYLCHLRYYNYDVLEKLEMDKICSVIVMATVHDAVHNIQDELMENSDQEQQIRNNISSIMMNEILAKTNLDFAKDHRPNQRRKLEIEVVYTSLPASARDIHYCDDISNISTSHVQEMRHQDEVEICRNLPLYGSCETQLYTWL